MNSLSSTINEHPFVVVDVYQSDCDPCKKFLKIFDRVEKELQAVGARIVKCELFDNPDVLDTYNIEKVPTFLYFKNGQEVHRHYGIKSIADMKQIIEQNT